jgi:hypothetical protein
VRSISLNVGTDEAATEADMGALVATETGGDAPDDDDDDDDDEEEDDDPDPDPDPDEDDDDDDDDDDDKDDEVNESWPLFLLLL